MTYHDSNTKEVHIMSTQAMNRRTFVQCAGAGLAAAAAPLVLPSRVCASSPEAPSNRFNIALVGCGGRGNDIVREALGNGANVIALCDADAARISGRACFRIASRSSLAGTITAAAHGVCFAT